MESFGVQADGARQQECGQQLPNVFRIKSTYKPSVRRTKSHKLAQFEIIINRFPKSISPLKTESITPNNTPTKHTLTALPASGSKRKSNLKESLNKSFCFIVSVVN